MAETKYLTPQEVSERLAGRITVKTLANWRYQGKGPKYVRFGSRILYSTAEVETYERSQAERRHRNSRRRTAEPDDEAAG
jgi:hypothetical protein